MTNTLSADINGITSENESFFKHIEFELIEPTTNSYYGTGCYMKVTLPNETIHVDIRYTKTRDLFILAENWINENIKDRIHELHMSKRIYASDNRTSHIVKNINYV